MKIYFKATKSVLIGAAAAFLYSCSDFIDINEDPNNSVVPQLNLLLPATQLSIIGNMESVNRGASAVVQHRGNGSLNRYDQTGTTFESSWEGFYTQAIPDLEKIIEVGTESGDWGYVGIAKIEKAYLYSIMTDLWGDIPFSEATKSANPKFDRGQDVYSGALALLDEGIADLDKGVAIVGSSDLFYQGNLAKWKKMASSLKLKLHLQTRLVDPEASRQAIISLINGSDLISDNSEDFTFQFGTNTAPNSRHPWYTAGYSPSRDGYVSMMVVDRLMAQDDPRLRYYIFRINEVAGLANSKTGEGYYGRYPGDGASSPADQNTRAIVGVYPSGGLYDNGLIPSLTPDHIYLNNIGATAGTTSNSFKVALFANGDGTGAGIFPLLTYSMVSFMRAEAALTLGTGEDAQALLEEAVAAQMKVVNSLSPSFALSDAAIAGFVARLGDKFLAADDAAKMELLMMQKWIALYGNGIESYNDYRRTGLPELEPLVSPLDVFPLRYYYSQTELTSNESLMDERDQLQRNQQITPVFWDK